MLCVTKQFPSLPFCGPRTKAHGVRGLSKYYHMRFNPKIGHGTCETLQIPCACAECTSTLDKPWISGLPPQQQPRCQPVTCCTYWPVLGSFNNCNIVTSSHKATTSDSFEMIHQDVLDGISDNIAYLVQYGK